MNRTIKFRVWDVDEQKMLRPSVELKHLLRQVSDRNDNSVGGDAIRRHDLAWMQFTGLKDKHGNEIYECDVLLYPYDPSGVSGTYWVIASVEFRGYGYGRQSHFWFRDRERTKPLTDSTWETSSTDFHKMWWYNDSVEIIGNVYENPELLKS